MRFLFFFLIFSLVNSQEISENVVDDVFNNIIYSIGNKHPKAPILVLKNSERSPASYDPDTKTINLEHKVLEICYSFGEDSLNALSYILAHELGHHYRNHGWMTHYASLDFSSEIDEKQEVSQQRVDDETEADLYAGFYAHLAGYNALSVAEEFLEKVYEEYNLPNAMSNYPTLEERKEIISKNKLDFELLNTIFETGNILLSLGEYSYSQELFEYILNRDFTSREIYNNLGLSYACQALSLNIENNFDVLIPFKIDLFSRLVEAEVSRGSLGTNQKAIELFNYAISQFDSALEQDSEYTLAKENIYYSQIALSYLEEDVLFRFTSDDMLSIDNVCESCILGHELMIQNKTRKAKKYFKKGSEICDMCSLNMGLDSKKTTINNSNNESNVLSLNQEIDSYCLDFFPDDCDIYHKLSPLKMCVSNTYYGRLIQLKQRVAGNSSCISIVEISSKDDMFNNNLGVNINQTLDDVLTIYENVKIIHSGVNKYVSLSDHPVTFLITNNIVSKIYFFEKIN